MYTDRNFKTKKALKEAVKAGEAVTYYQPNAMWNSKSPYDQTGTVHFVVEGPHYPAAHTWYAECEAVNGKIVKVR